MIRSFITVLACLMLSSAALAGTLSSERGQDSLSRNEIDRPATYPGGSEQLAKDLYRIIKYPLRDVESGIEGRVEVEFIVEKDGSLSNITIAKGVSDSLDAEALRVVKKLKAFTPAMKNTEAVRMALILPIHFKLEDEYEAQGSK